MDSSYLLGGKRITVGASTVIEFNASSFEQGFVLKKVLGSSFTVSLVDGLSFAWNTGYEIEDSEIIIVSGPAKFFLAAAGITGIIQIGRSYSSSATGLPTLPPVPLGLL